jgi:pimeloyl-ACP methyl ester carboxylesterase
MAGKLTHNFVSAPDGTNLSYYTIGIGPSVLILHGSASFALTHRELAIALSPHYTVYIASRRGRGLSGGYPASVTGLRVLNNGEKPATTTVGGNTYVRSYTPEFTAAVLAIEAEDLNALIAATKAEYLICVSSGALITLHTLFSSSSDRPIHTLKRIIIFEPPAFFSDHSTTSDLSGVRRFEEERLAGDDAAAMVTAMRVVQLGPGWIPRWLMRHLAGMMMRSQDKDIEKRRAAGEEDQGVATMRGLGDLIRYDFAVAEGMMGDSKAFAALGEGVGKRIVLLGGSRSPEYLKQATEILALAIPGAKRVVINGVGHEVLCGAEMRGRPENAVPAILDIFR